MGFEMPREEAVLTFEGGRFAGAEIRVRLNVDFGTYLRIQTYGDTTEETYRAWVENWVIGWNLMADGLPISRDAEGIQKVDTRLLFLAFDNWRKAVEKEAGVAPPLGESSESTPGASPSFDTWEPEPSDQTES